MFKSKRKKIKINENQEKQLAQIMLSDYITRIVDSLVQQEVKNNPKANGSKYTDDEKRLIAKSCLLNNKDILTIIVKTFLKLFFKLGVPEDFDLLNYLLIVDTQTHTVSEFNPTTGEE